MGEGLFQNLFQTEVIKPSGEAVQYIIVRDDLGMSPGKMAAQCAHASSSISLAFFGLNRGIIQKEYLKKHAEVFEHWCRGSFAKVVLKVKSKSKLRSVSESLSRDAYPHVVIRDACRTELSPEDEEGGTTTCLAAVPVNRDSVPDYLRKLQLFT